VHRLILPLTLTVVACGPGAAPSHSTETLPNGAVRVINTGTGAWGASTAWRAIEVLRIGREEGTGPEVFGFPAALEADAEGNVYVLDGQANEVRVFDARGEHLRTMGRTGAGPGEFRQPAGLSLAPGGDLWVYDPQNNRFSVFSPDGALRATHRRESGLTAIPWRGGVDRAGRVWDTDSGPGGFGGSPSLVWTRFDGEGATKLDLPPFTVPSFTNAAGNVRATVPFAPWQAWTIDADGVVWSGTTDAYRIHRHQPGGDTILVVELAVDPVAVSPAERDTALSQLGWFTQQGGRVDAGQIPSHKPAFTNLRVDHRGYLWVTPSLPAGTPGVSFDVFDPQGIHQGRLTLPIEEWSPVVVRGDRLYSAVLAPEGHPQIVVFRLEGRS
jgi:hypothetical protein